jgi:small subunit ribosomal protein S4
VYRSGIASSRAAARQIVAHGHITVNGKKLDIPSYRVKIGEVVAVKESAKKSKLFESTAEKMSKIEIPAWLGADTKQLSVKVLNAPVLENPQFNAKSIIEFYSR